MTEDENTIEVPVEVPVEEPGDDTVETMEEQSEDIGIEEVPLNPKVTVHYNVGLDHELYNPDGSEEFNWEELRAKRNSRLKLADKYQGILFYSTLTKIQQGELAIYRQALLDITKYDTTAEAWDNWPTRLDWMN